MEALLHSTIDRDHLERAVSGYEAVFGPEALAPTRVGTFQATYNGQRYIVLGTAKRVLAVYRIRPGVGSLKFLANWAKALERLHRRRVVHYSNPSAWPDPRRRSGGVYGV
jgi:hypothetical protein